MTLCIAAHAQDNGQRKIVLCSDALIGDEMAHTEAAFKSDVGFTKTLASLYSGVWDEAQDLVRILKDHANSLPLKMGNIKQVLTRGRQEFQKAMEERGVEASNAQCIIAGFLDGEPQIIYVDREYVYSQPSRAGIGIGYTHADTILSWRRLNERSTLERVAYCLFEAKKFAELCGDVGKNNTAMEILSMGLDGSYKVDIVKLAGLEFLQSCFKRFGPQAFDELLTFPEKSFRRL